MPKFNPSILLVDDQEDNIYTLERRLKKDGYTQLTSATNGTDALQLINSNPYDLILLDLMMPDISGLEVLEEIKSDPNLRHIPVIMITASDEREIAAKCIKSGADDFITKPFNSTILQARVSSSLNKKMMHDMETQYFHKIEEEKKQSDELLHSVLPKMAIGDLKSQDYLKPRRYEDVVLLVSDLVSFTSFSEKNSPEAVVESLQSLFEHYEESMSDYGFEKIKTIGDAFFAVSGIHTFTDQPIISAIKLAAQMQNIASASHQKWRLHCGIHKGPVVAGIFGKQPLQFDLLGHTVNTAFRICDYSEENEILMSQSAWMSCRKQVRAKSKGILELNGGIHLELMQFTNFKI